MFSVLCFSVKFHISRFQQATHSKENRVPDHIGRRFQLNYFTALWDKCHLIDAIIQIRKCGVVLRQFSKAYSDIYLRANTRIACSDRKTHIYKWRIAQKWVFKHMSRVYIQICQRNRAVWYEKKTSSIDCMLNQTVRMRLPFWNFPRIICPNTVSHDASHVIIFIKYNKIKVRDSGKGMFVFN